MLTFYWPWCALLILLPGIFHYIINKRTIIIGKNIVLFPRLARLKLALKLEGPIQKTVKCVFFFWYLLWIFLVFTMMRPEWVNKALSTERYTYDLLLAVDLSQSMNALDFSQDGHKITRWQATKQVVDQFIQQRDGDRIGLLVFGEQAYPYVPLTFDAASVSQQLKQLMVGMAGDATSIGDAIGLAVKNLQHRKGEKILILVTDGEDTASQIPPLQAAKLAAKHGIKIYTIGVGSNGMVPIQDRNGQITMFEAHLDEGLLKEIAKITGGLYAKAISGKSLEEIYEKINSLEKNLSKDKVVRIRTSLHQVPLGLALLSLVTLITLSWRQYHVV